MLTIFCVLFAIFYLAFLVDWELFRKAFSQGAWVALAINCLIAVGFFVAKANHVIAAVGSGHH